MRSCDICGRKEIPQMNPGGASHFEGVWGISDAITHHLHQEGSGQRLQRKDIPDRSKLLSSYGEECQVDSCSFRLLVMPGAVSSAVLFFLLLSCDCIYPKCEFRLCKINTSNPPPRGKP